MEKNIECVLGVDFVVRADMAICEGDRHYFIKKVVRPYTQLRKDIHYKELNDKINEDMVNEVKKLLEKLIKLYRSNSRVVDHSDLLPMHIEHHQLHGYCLKH